jgi:hypothetical protein
MLNLLLPALFLLAQDPAAAPPAAPPAAQAPAPPAPAPEAPAPAAQPAASTDAPPAAVPGTPQAQKPLSFFSQRFKFRWDQFLPLTAVVDSLKINSIFFNERSMSLFKGAKFGTRAVVDVTNTGSTSRKPGFAVAVFDAQDRLLGVASGGPTLGGVGAGETESFTLSFHDVMERIPRADHFILTVELSE